MNAKLSDYKTTEEAARAWNVTPRMIHHYISEGRIPGAVKISRVWFVPAAAQKPTDKRVNAPEKNLSADLDELIVSTALSMPITDPDAYVRALKDDRQRLHYELQLAYLRCDYERIKQCWHGTESDIALRIHCGGLMIAAAIASGDYPFFSEVEQFMKRVVKTAGHEHVKTCAELSLCAAYTGALAHNMTPDWLKKGDLSAVIPNNRPVAVYFRVKYFQALRDYNPMLVLSQTIISLFSSTETINYYDVYFRLMCAIACCGLNRHDEAEEWLRDALRIGLPAGFISPFAELLAEADGLLQRILQKEYPGYYDTIFGQWKFVVKNWIDFHNRFAKANITFMLSLRDYQIAKAYAKGASYKEIAARLHISYGSVGNAMQEIYETLFITGNDRKRQLAKYIL